MTAIEKIEEAVGAVVVPVGANIHFAIQRDKEGLTVKAIDSDFKFNADFKFAWKDVHGNTIASICDSLGRYVRTWWLKAIEEIIGA